MTRSRRIVIDAAGRPGLRITGGAKVPVGAGETRRERGCCPSDRGRSLSGMPSPFKSARNGVSDRPTPLPAAAGSKVPSPSPRSTPIALS